MTTFKLPEPTHTNPVGKPFYTEAQLKQALKDVLEQAAKRCEYYEPENCRTASWLSMVAGDIRKMIGEIK